MATEEEASDWKEQYGDFNSVEESETDAKTLAKQIIKIFNENKEQIIKHIPKGYEENFLKLLEE